MKNMIKGFELHLKSFLSLCNQTIQFLLVWTHVQHVPNGKYVIFHFNTEKRVTGSIQILLSGIFKCSFNKLLVPLCPSTTCHGRLGAILLADWTSYLALHTFPLHSLALLGWLLPTLSNFSSRHLRKEIQIILRLFPSYF